MSPMLVLEVEGLAREVVVVALGLGQARPRLAAFAFLVDRRCSYPAARRPRRLPKIRRLHLVEVRPALSRYPRLAVSLQRR